MALARQPAASAWILVVGIEMVEAETVRVQALSPIVQEL
jgi:hypothetical protein